MIYHLHWIDRYVGQHRVGVTHASVDGGVSMCGIDYSSKMIDGGYHTTSDYDVECKKCLKAIKLYNEKQKNNKL